MFTRSLQSADGTTLRVDGYPSESPESRGVVVLIHGFAEHRRRYGHVAAHFNKHGYHVLAGDLRGHGESGGDRGYIERFGDYVDDVTAFIGEAQRAFSGGTERPPVLVGHSMAGWSVWSMCCRIRRRHERWPSPLRFLGSRLRFPGGSDPLAWLRRWFTLG